MGCGCNKSYPTLRGRTFQVPTQSYQDTYQESVPSPGVSKVVPNVCPIKTLPTCDQCQTITVSALPECDAEELAQNPCTLIVADSFQQETCYTAGKAIRRALRDLDGDNRFDDNLKKYVSDFNQVIDELNVSPMYRIQIPKTAVVKSCGNCEYFLPEDFKQMITLTNDLPQNKNYYKVKKFINPPHEQFFGSNIPEHYTIFDNKIIIKNPKECGCKGNTDCARFLKAHYWAKLPRAHNLDDCLGIPADEQVLINLNLTINIGTMLGLNADKVALSQQKLNEIRQMTKSYNNRKFDKPRYVNTGISITSWLGQ